MIQLRSLPSDRRGHLPHSRLLSRRQSRHLPPLYSLVSNHPLNPSRFHHLRRHVHRMLHRRRHLRWGPRRGLRVVQHSSPPCSLHPFHCPILVACQQVFLRHIFLVGHHRMFLLRCPHSSRQIFPASSVARSPPRRLQTSLTLNLLINRIRSHRSNPCIIHQWSHLCNRIYYQPFILRFNLRVSPAPSQS